MMQKSDERIFLIILILNLIVALLYLFIGIMNVALHDEMASNDPKEQMYDRRLVYFFRFCVMLLCPVIGPLYFLVSYIIYIGIFWKKADLADVIFNKERVKTHAKANEDRERNLIPLEEAILLNEKKDLRSVMLNVVMEDFHDNLSVIRLALNSEDSETSHYAAAVLSSELNTFRAHINKLWNQLQKEDSNSVECEMVLLDSMNDLLKQNIFSQSEQLKYVKILEGAAQSFYDKRPEEFQLKWYEEVCLRTLELELFDLCEKWCIRLARQFPEELSSYTCQLKLYFALQNQEAFFKTLNELKHSQIVIDSETLELIRIFS